MEKEREIVQLLHELRGVLYYQQQCQIDTYSASKELDTFLNSCSWPSSASTNQKISASPVVLQTPAASDPIKTDGCQREELAEIEKEIQGCTACVLARQRSCTVSGEINGSRTCLMIVGHWIVAQESSKHVFGQDEDSMLRRMLRAINISMEDVFITNVIKCSIANGTQPGAQHIDTCLSYLVRQIKVVAPAVILAMGTVATKSLLQLPQPLSQIRGRLYPFTGIEGLEIPVLPTYHPGFLLQNPEMKMATWQDLQFLEQHLAKR